jgi:hypothetical protein
LPSAVLAMAWRTLMTPILVPVAEPGAALCALAPKAQAEAITANSTNFPSDPERVRVNILEFTFFSFFRIA